MTQSNGSVIIGVTGGIGSGKSTVSSILRDFGAVVIDADLISRQVVMPGEKALEELTEFFGKSILDECGRLQRKKLADIVFNNREKLEKLNGIVHKYVADKIKVNVKEQLNKNTKIIVIDAPIPIKSGFLDLCHQVWTVSADKELRIRRIMKRSEMTYEEALSRIKSQLSEQEYLKIADIVIDNNGDYSRLKEQVKCELNKLLG